jgi:glycosyltransferase involved in cell wall biosynthesis
MVHINCSENEKGCEASFMTLFIGPVANEGGPSIKNRLLLKYLDEENNFTICNTYKRSLSNLAKTIFSLIISRDRQIIVAVSKNGRSILYPILIIKKKLNSNIHYSTICIGGTIVNEAIKHPKKIKNALKNADIVTVETKKLKIDLEEKCNLSNVHYMPNYKEIPKNIIKNVSGFKSNQLKFVFLSSIRNVKGVGTMITVFKEILNKYPLASLDIYGPVREDFDTTIFDDIKNIPQINYKGIVPNEDVITVLAQYNVFIFPTEYIGEGFPAVLVEAYLAGLVVIASDINFNTEIVANNVNGWIFPTGDKKQLKKLLFYCFDNVEKLKNISRYNTIYAKNFDAKSVLNKYKQALFEKEWEL